VRYDDDARTAAVDALDPAGRSQGAERHDVSHATRLRLLVLLPVTMAVLVAATGFFAVSMTERYGLIYGSTGPALHAALNGLTLQVGAIAGIAAVLGFALALGVTAPLKQVASQLEAMASGDLQGAIDVKSTTEVDSVAGAFNDAVRSINRYIFQSMTGAVITLNTDGVVIGSSPATEVVLGYREEELVGKRFSDVFAPSAESRTALAVMEDAIRRRATVALENVVIAARDGRPMRIGVNVSYLRPRAGSDDKTTIGVMIAFKDLTEIRRLRDRLQQADQLVALGTLTAGVAHELRNPLASLQGLVELLGRDFEDGDPRRRYTRTMLDAIDRLNRLVEDLLLLSAPGAAGAAPVDLNFVVRDTVTFTRLGLGDKPVTLSFAEAPGAPVVIGNQTRLGQALTNIILNAVQATPAGGTVRVSTAVDGAHTSVRVHNTGSFIDEEQQKKLFVPFFTTKPTGTGLGLAIARQIVTAHGGRIDVESDQAAGTTFTIELPVAGQTAGAAADVTDRGLAAAASGGAAA
jgi:two-component system, NtrC family, sensor histidine kinase AtoS